MTYERRQVITSGYVHAEPRDRITCLLCDGHVTVPRGHTIPLTDAHLGHICGDPPVWDLPQYTPSPHGRPLRRREPTLTPEARRAFELAARTEDVNA